MFCSRLCKYDWEKFLNMVVNGGINNQCFDCQQTEIHIFFIKSSMELFFMYLSIKQTFCF